METRLTVGRYSEPSPEEPIRMDLNGLAYGLEFLQHARADPDANQGSRICRARSYKGHQFRD